ncbi:MULTISPECIES: hypothetical protein [unclassified Massilia]|uniref:hypothetical protein n=1 Tax=unclassified Massilia TaxID=2609279 RepID=UPI000689AA7B|nr:MULTISPECIES: hypothetical protein [unclassified Massilia]AWG45916.1 hypothetical protein AM586_28090 [Massilia sp. WG5]
MFRSFIGVIGACSLFISPELSAQTLHAPSRTLFKCQDHGKITYSDSPCLGAEKLEVEPTRGVNKLSGKERVGADVRRELNQEMFANAVRPLTGLDAQQFAVQVRRYHLPGSAQQECRRLDQDITTSEYEEKRTAPAALRDVQARLFLLRQRFRELRC